MKALIMLPQPILVSDELLRIGERCYGKDINNSNKTTVHQAGSHDIAHGHLKVIAGLPDLPKLDLSLIADEIGWVDVEKLAEEKFPDESTAGWIDSFSPRERRGFTEGFRAAQSLNEKRYTKSDVIKAMEYALENKCPFQVELYQYFIDDLSQPKEYLVQVETNFECCGEGYYTCEHCNQTPYSKITNNTIKITRIL